ncbi:MAG: hypothetical protein ACREV7_08025 [Steroidobacteraceae bacterium]
MSRALAPCLGDAHRRTRLIAWALLLCAAPTLPALALAAAGDSALEVRTLATTGAAPTAAEVARGALDKSFAAPASAASLPQIRGTHWVRLEALRSIAPPAIPVILVGSSVDLQVVVYARGSGTPLLRAAMLPGFGGTQQAAFSVSGTGLEAGQVFYACLRTNAASLDRVYFGATTLRAVLARGARHALRLGTARDLLDRDLGTAPDQPRREQ